MKYEEGLLNLERYLGILNTNSILWENNVALEGLYNGGLCLVFHLL